MGLLAVGATGAGKTFVIKAFLKEAGLSAVARKNFRSKWVGSTESNLERVLSAVKAMGPIAVIIDEDDRSFGGRSERSDGGKSSRVIARLQAFLSDPDNRGNVLFVLLTHRPDKLDTDIKRPGEAIALRTAIDLTKYSGIPNVVFVSAVCRSTPGSCGGANLDSAEVSPNLDDTASAQELEHFQATPEARPAYAERDIVVLGPLDDECFRVDPLDRQRQPNRQHHRNPARHRWLLQRPGTLDLLAVVCSAPQAGVAVGSARVTPGYEAVH